MAEEAVKQQIALRKLECEETMNASSILSGVFCKSRFDGWSCWPDTPAGSTANQSCPDFLIGFDPTRKAFHKCETTGEWFQHPQFNKTWANYTTCVNVEDFEFRKQINLVYSVGYGISLVALLVSLALLTYFKSLRCARITVHMNLFASFAINNFLWLLWYTFVVNDTDVVSENKNTSISVMVLYELAGVLVAIVAVAIAFFKWKFTFWNNQSIRTFEPSIPFGNVAKLFTGKTTFGEQFQEFYNQLKAEGVHDAGLYVTFRPNYMPLDPEIIKNIMQRDFQHFVNHGTYIDEEVDPLSGHLFSLEDTKWRNMRVKLTPTFTSGKMKMMFQTLADCTEGLKDIMDQSVKDKSGVDIKDVLGRFTTDIIGSCAFGLECNSLKNPDAEFRKYGKLVFEVTLINQLRGLLPIALPRRLLRLFRFKVTRSDVESFFMNAVKETVKYRETNNVHRKDFMHLLLQLKNRGKVSDDGKVTDDDGGTGGTLTINELAAQAFVFFIAGFETSSTATTFALFELATNPDIQDKLRDEINAVLAKHQALTYDAIMEMTYMDKVLYETLRKYPPIPALLRICTKDYVVEKTGAKLKKGVQVIIPVLGLHHDPEYYPEPEKFDPERFSEENKSKRPAFTYLPFGEGPRVCIGLRFGMMQSKVALTTLLKNYRITLNKKTKTPLTLDKQSFITLAEGGIWLDVKKL